MYHTRTLWGGGGAGHETNVYHTRTLWGGGGAGHETKPEQ